LAERKTYAQLGELLGLEPVSLVIKKVRLKWFGLAEYKDNTDLMKCCMMTGMAGTARRRF